MLDKPESAIEPVISAIETYLAQHPAAADSEQGVAQWWLPAMGIDVSIEQVRRALEILWQRDVLERKALPDGGAVYRAVRQTS